MFRTRINRTALGLGGAALMVLGGASTSSGQITRAGAVGTLNPVPTAFRSPTVFRGHSTYRSFPTCRPCGGGYVNHSRGIYGGGIVYRSGVSVSLGTGLPVGTKHHRGFRCGTYPTYISTSSTYDGWPLWEVDRRVYVDGAAPEVVVLEVPRVDEGIEALRAGRFVDARLIYLERAQERREKEEAGEVEGVDREALRLAGFAAAGAGRFAEAERLMTQAYEEDSSLAVSPLRGKALVGGPLEMRRLVTGAVAFAHREPSAGAWNTVAWLMQAEGRHDLARKMAERGEALRLRSTMNGVKTTGTADFVSAAAVE